MIINIIGGGGVMGSVHGKIFEKYGHEIILSGRNSNPSIEEACKKSDVTIVSVPIEATEEVIRKIGKYCKAIMDFTSLKRFPLEAMLKYSDKNCEVAGLHPLYGDVKSIIGQTIVLCKTKRTGKKCAEIVECLRKEGAKIIDMSAEEHDKKVTSLNQVLRLREITAYVKTMSDFGYSLKEMYNIAPPPTKLLIELFARQINEKNDSMYFEMIKNDSFLAEIEEKFIDNFKKTGSNYDKVASELRSKIGPEFLDELKDKIKDKIE